MKPANTQRAGHASSVARLNRLEHSWLRKAKGTGLLRYGLINPGDREALHDAWFTHCKQRGMVALAVVDHLPSRSKWHAPQAMRSTIYYDTRSSPISRQLGDEHFLVLRQRLRRFVDDKRFDVLRTGYTGYVRGVPPVLVDEVLSELWAFFADPTLALRTGVSRAS